MFREKIKVLDCTIRDGGLINNHGFDTRFVREVYKALSESGVDYMEIGYKNSKKLFSPKEFGKWKFCDDEDIKKIRTENRKSSAFGYFSFLVFRPDDAEIVEIIAGADAALCRFFHAVFPSLAAREGCSFVPGMKPQTAV